MRRKRRKRKTATGGQEAAPQRRVRTKRKIVTQKQKVMNLWRLCFNDSEDFIQRYFKKIMPLNTLYTSMDGNQVVASLQTMHPFFKYYGKLLHCRYIYGVCTHPDYRRQGRMSELLNQLIEETNRIGTAFLLLIPAEDWLFDVYRQFGFTEAFFIEDKIVTMERSPKHPSLIRPVNFQTHRQADYCEQRLQQYPLHIWADSSKFRFAVQDARSEGGDCFYYLEDREIRGVIIAAPRGDEVFVSLLLADTEAIERDLLAHVARRFGCPTVHYRVMSTQGKGRPYAMAILSNPKSAFPIWKENHPDSQLTLEEFLQFDNQQRIDLLFEPKKEKSYLCLMMD